MGGFFFSGLVHGGSLFSFSFGVWPGRLAAAVRWLAKGSPLSHVSISDSGFGMMSLSCSGVKLPVGGLLESGGLCRGGSAASRWMALDSGRSCVPHFFVDNLPRVPPVMSGLHVWW